MIMQIADDLESTIDEFLNKNPNGGELVVPETDYELALPLMIATYEDRGWRVYFECENGENVFLFQKNTFRKYLGDDWLALPQAER